jgi:hypothetical protein
LGFLEWSSFTIFYISIVICLLQPSTPATPRYMRIPSGRFQRRMSTFN